MSESVVVSSSAELAELVRHDGDPLRFSSGGTKPVLSRASAGEVQVSLASLRGVVAYDPAEFTVSVRAGTPLTELQELLGEHGQYLPFDPQLAAAGASIGGTVASGLSGPGRFGWGGIRDYVLEVRFVDGLGSMVRGGGRVVKNAAGFDLPKLMVGSCGCYGPLVELTLKVFPRPELSRTFALPLRAQQRVGEPDRGVVAFLEMLNQREVEPEACEIEFAGGRVAPADAARSGPRALLRFSGRALALEQRLARVREILESELCAEAPVRLLGVEEQQETWRRLCEWSWAAPSMAVAKATGRPRTLCKHLAQRRSDETWWLSAGGHQILLAAPPARVAELAEDMPGLLPLRCSQSEPEPAHWSELRELAGGATRPRHTLAHAVRRAIDPRGRFV